MQFCSIIFSFSDVPLVFITEVGGRLERNSCSSIYEAHTVTQTPCIHTTASS